ncbi:TIM-barrel domain-containing protein [Parasediminibacterium sp. JCM 36343]|uniref:glycoside hydrolase family 31 protein n=1 Tax=Parasediminibacterium sp. JCM 36343 TaxID=3374279 RepID=UPI003978C408
MKRIYLLLPALFIIAVNGFTQTKNIGNTTIVALGNSKCSFQQVTPNIIKITFQPKGYTTNENLSDAVILKPSAKVMPNIEKKGETIVIAHKLWLKGTHNTGDYRGFRFALTKDEQIFGGGERALPLNRRGYRLDLYNAPWYGYGEGADHLNYSVPFFTSSKGYALFFDNPSRSYVDIGKTESSIFEYGAKSGALAVYLIVGSNYKEILQSYYSLTGTQPLPPRWALGNLMSRFGYTSEAQVEDIYGKMKADNIPVDAVIFDLFWFGDSIKNSMGNLDWVKKTKWPDPKSMIANFRKNNVNTILVTEPFVVKNTLAYNSAQPFLATDSLGKPYQIPDFYFGNAGLIDIFRKDAKDWFWQYYKKQMDMGVEAWWGDLGEPEMHPTKMFHNLKDKGFLRLFSADEVHNIYGHNWTKMLFDKYATDFPNKRLFSLNRSGFAGTQRYSIFPWTGDVSRSWGGLKAQLPVLLGMSMSGVPYVHSDAGGFAGGEGDNELYIRWLQMAAFTPIFRPHGTALYEIEKAAFSFPSEAALIAEPYKTIAKSVINQRYRFLAYNYTLAYQQAINKQPLMRPLYYENPTDTAAYNANDEYYWGENMIVAPVLGKNDTTRSVYLPHGIWYNYQTNEIVEGKNRFSQSVSLDAIPIYVKAGTLLPQYADSIFSNTVDIEKDKLTINYYPSTTASAYSLYMDDGTSKNKNAIATEQYELINFTAKTLAGKGYSFTIHSNNGTYIGKPAKQTITLSIQQAMPCKTVLVNGIAQQLPPLTANNTLSFPVEFVGKDLKVEVRM